MEQTTEIYTYISTMGIMILPFLFAALIPGVIAIIKTIKLFVAKTIGLKEIAFGLLTSLCLFGMICLVYLLEGEAWGLSPAFRLPIFMVFLPFIIHLWTAGDKNTRTKYFSRILLISVGITCILGMVFNSVFFHLIDYLGIQKYY